MFFFFFFFEQERAEGFTQEEFDFLEKHGLLEFVFDAKGMSFSKYRLKMKELNKLVAYNVTPCKKAGHKLRFRDGHCCQCYPSQMGYRETYNTARFVYIAGSLTDMVIKVGSEKKKTGSEPRSKSVNRTGYADIKDWEILFRLESEDAGEIEVKTHRLLKSFAKPFYYNHDGHLHKSRETFDCSYSKALEALKETCSKYDFNFNILEEATTKKFEFTNRKK